MSSLDDFLSLLGLGESDAGATNSSPAAPAMPDPEKAKFDAYGQYLDTLSQPGSAAMSGAGVANAVSALPSQAPAPAPAPPSALPSDSAPVGSISDTIPSVQQYIAKQYGFGPGLDQNALQTAQQNAAQGQMLANLGGAFNTIAHGIAARGGNKQPVDNSAFEAMGKEAQSPVQNILQQRQAQVQDTNFAQSQENNDPNSVKAAILRKQLSPLAQKVGLNPNDLQNMSVEDLKSFSTGPLEFAAKLQQQKESLQASNDLKKAIYGNKVDTQDTKYDVSSLKDLNGNKEYTQAQARIDKANGLINNIAEAQSNPTARKALATELGLYISGGQRLHTSTVEAMGGNQGGILNRLQQSSADLANGTLSSPNAQFLSDFVRNEAAASQAEASAIKARSAQDFQSIHGRLPRWADPSAAAPAQAQPSAGSNPTLSSSQRVKVLSPDGKPGTIPASQLQDALSQGYKQVQ